MLASGPNGLGKYPQRYKEITGNGHTIQSEFSSGNRVGEKESHVNYNPFLNVRTYMPKVNESSSYQTHRQTSSANLSLK